MILSKDAPPVFTRQQLDQLGHNLASKHYPLIYDGGDRLLKQLKVNEDVLRSTYSLLRTSAYEGHKITPAGDWLLDNFHVIEDQIQTARRHLPKSFCRELPMVNGRQDCVEPRVYRIASELIFHTDGKISKEALNTFLNSYQNHTPLRLGELWAFPIMLRLGLLDNLRKIAESIAANDIDQRNAKIWVEKLVKTSKTSPHDIVMDIADLSRSNPRLSSAFVAEFARRIQNQCHCPSLPLGWIEHRVEDHGLSIEHHRYLVSQDQAHDQMSISNSITSLRFLNETDWRDFVEGSSKVEEILLRDPAGIYGKMDFATRNLYRHRIEYMARYSKKDEISVADSVLEMAEKNREHIGLYLVGQKKRDVEKHLHVRKGFREQIKSMIVNYPVSYYLGLLAIICAIMIWYPLHIVSQSLDYSVKYFVFILLLLFPASQSALEILNWFTASIIKPKQWPRMNFKRRVPDCAKTVVVVPCLLSNESTIDKLMSDLEVRYLGNKDPNISFALLSDFVDADSESCPEDKMLLECVENRLEELNFKYYETDKRQPFFLFHRPRKWNSKEKKWMGFERKRGKIHDFNELLIHGKKGPFLSIRGDVDAIYGSKYVITLDADSTLPRETAVQLIATIAHPLNHPVFDEDTNVVTSGFSILQPRVTLHVQDGEASLFTRLFSDSFGIDPYTKSISDIYQDLFDEGSFIGKGIYDVRAFQRSLTGRFPENRILSHDLIEGGFSRSGLVSDVQLVEEYPAEYSTDVKRKHRWMRGDWQIAAWIFPFAPDSTRRFAPNPLSLLSKWKIFDNIRRAICPLATLGLLLCSWFWQEIPAFSIALIWFAYLLSPLILNVLSLRISTSGQTDIKQILYEKLNDFGKVIAHFFITITFLPFEAYQSADASVSSLYRMMITKRNLLQWQTAEEAKRSKIFRPLSYYRMMWICPVLAVIVSFLLLEWGNDLGAQAAMPFCVAWMFAPALAWWVSRPTGRVAPNLSADQTEFLRAISRRTWAYFEDFVNQDENWLPPDNYQEYPDPVVAHRTSPTNIGLSLLSSLAAYDFGYISLDQLVKRTEGLFDSLSKMARFKGHFFNWYDTQSLQPLNPHYISSVDSGNLLGAFVVFRQGSLELANAKLWSGRILPGLDDIFIILTDLLKSAPKVPEDIATRLTFARVFIKDKLSTHFESDEDERMQLCQILQELLETVEGIDIPELSDEFKEFKSWLNRLHDQLQSQLFFLMSLNPEKERHTKGRLRSLAEKVAEFSKQDYRFLYNKENKLLSIGYHVIEDRRDQSYYDLLASEARLASFLAISTGNLPQEHWFALGRQLVLGKSGSALLSWSGSMFEYLMPLLIMPNHPGTLLDKSCRNAIQRQIEYGNERKVPWGVSESGYNLTDLHFNYQYRAFGVPGLGFKGGLEQDLVIAPYATAMALMLEPIESCQNLQKLAKSGYLGMYGFYEAVDFTPSRLPVDAREVLIKSFMVHHQGMSFLSFARHLLNQPMQRRLQKDLAYKSTELLLYERVPKALGRIPDVFLSPEIRSESRAEAETFRVLTDPDPDVPEVHLMGNGRYHVMVTSAGSGYSSWNNLQLTRWRQDRTCDANGFYIFLKDLNSDSDWSATYQPSLKGGEKYEAIFSEGRAEFRRSDNGISTHTEIAVSPDEDAELRRLTISNYTNEVKNIEVTTYAEVVMAEASQDESHPAFSNLFVESEILSDEKGVICHRRPRDTTQESAFLYHSMVIHSDKSKAGGIETDRLRFIGRGQNIHNPSAATHSLTNSFGSVLDPVISIRKSVAIKPGDKVVVDCVMGISKTRDQADDVLSRFREKHILDRVLELSWTHGHVLLRQLNCTESDAVLYGKMASYLIYGGSPLRAETTIIRSNKKSQSSLWSYGVSGDLPIVLLKLHSQSDLDLLRQTVRGHDYWRRKGLLVDLIIWNDSQSSYRQDLSERIIEVIAMASALTLIDQPGGIFIRRPDQMPDEDKILIQAAASIILSDQMGHLEDQIQPRKMANRARQKTLEVSAEAKTIKVRPASSWVVSSDQLKQFNGMGGFSENGREYVIKIDRTHRTPMPWVNVLANPEFGTLISESGSSYTWSENSQLHRLTPWSNDPVSDPSGEAIYLRDENSGEHWCPTPGPRPGSSEYEVKHGFGYSIFSTQENNIYSETTYFVTAHSPVKICRVRLKNSGTRRRNISAFCYLELVLGDLKRKTSSYILSEVDPGNGYLYARNTFGSDFAGRVAFLSSTEEIVSYTGDRTEFIGRNGSLEAPTSLKKVSLSGEVGSGMDPCLAIQVQMTLGPGEERDFAFHYGIAKDYDKARELSRQYSNFGQVESALMAVHQQWELILNKIQVDTPDFSTNTLSNGWLLYQAISSRLWGRTGFYQSGGAFGFRDQLQDMMALVYTVPELVREHILRCASRQFIEGDVQHWWHPPTGRGVRTFIRDDLLWLPFVVDHYIKITGDRSILDESVAFLSAGLLQEGEESNYSLPMVSEESGSVYEHCKRSILQGMKYGVHGLPLMGSGDWNDGMNQVGILGKGESVWLAFFLIDNLNKFSELALSTQDVEFADVCLDHVKKLRAAVEEHGWDGEWYLRAYFDDGSALGTRGDYECQIDSLPQSWSVLSGSKNIARSKQAMDSVYDRLVNKEPGLVRLFKPAFNKHLPNPGYVAGYIAGIRENGGQYTHAALWVVMAFAEIGEVDRAFELLQLINPLEQGKNDKSMKRYKVEPYVVAADVYSSPMHLGRGGWTWYTGAAAWYYRAVLEFFLGFELRKDVVTFHPKLPSHWSHFKVSHRYGEAEYIFNICREEHFETLELVECDCIEVDAPVKLIDDAKTHQYYVLVPRVSVSSKMDPHFQVSPEDIKKSSVEI